MTARKTIKTRDLIDSANDYMQSTCDSARLDRLHVQDFVSGVLREARAYCGFTYLRPHGAANADSSRIKFNVHPDLLA